jgi:hypothetical protein
MMSHPSPSQVALSSSFCKRTEAFVAKTEEWRVAWETAKSLGSRWLQTLASQALSSSSQLYPRPF